VEFLKIYNIKSYADKKNIGVWVNGKKIAAIGIRVSQWIAYHGCSINVCNDLEHYKKIVPCGLDNNKITSIYFLPLGGNHITSYISKILEIYLEQAENLKINFSKNINDDYYSEEMFKKIIFSRSEEILEMCARIIGLNLITADKYKIILMGEGSKIFKNQYEDKLFPINSVDFLEETTESICLSGFKLAMGLNKQEVVVIPKKQIKQGFFEKLFHLFN
jgi:cell division protein FtsA